MSNDINIKYKDPDIFFPKQQLIYDADKRYTVVIASNKSGKTLVMACWINRLAILGPPNSKYCWLAPYSKQTKVGYDAVKDMIVGSSLYKYLDKIKHKKQFKFNGSHYIITYPNGNKIEFLQGQNVEALYSEKYFGAVVDEGTRLKQEIDVDGTISCPAFDALETNLMTTRGPIKLISNPTTKNNWLYKWYMRIMESVEKQKEK